MTDTAFSQGPDQAASLTEMLRGDQRLRWMQGQRVRVEAYLEHFPQLQQDREARRELILGELRLCRELGEPIDTGDLERRFPDDADWLAAQWERLNPTSSREPTLIDEPDEAGSTAWPNVPGYDILDEVGRGGMGVVYRAIQRKLNRVVAIKALRHRSTANVRSRQRLRKEAEAIARLQHPFIVQLYDMVEHDGDVFLILEYVRGASLSARLRKERISIPEASRLATQIAQAMQHAHDHGIIHRDLKPSNILLTVDGMPKITDFGLAKRLDDDFSHTQSGTLLGTPDYMAPEQAEGRIRDIGPATDIYSMGCILYEMLTGRPPFRHESMIHLLDAIRFQTPTPPRALRPEIPVVLEAICLRCLRKVAAERFPTAGQLATELERFLSGPSNPATEGGSRIFSWFRRWWRGES
ncbi:MAG: serine/threonine protein kinase [Gemmataceae bacterium]|nr:serine/threonine protein kinase [Gemmataceae bacterium]